MRRSPLACGLIFAAAVVSFAILMPGPADAQCQGICTRISPGCRVCENAGQETGALCDQSGPCGCFYVICPFSASQTFEADSMSVDPEAHHRTAIAAADQSREDCAASTDSLAVLFEPRSAADLPTIPDPMAPVR